MKILILVIKKLIIIKKCSNQNQRNNKFPRFQSFNSNLKDYYYSNSKKDNLVYLYRISNVNLINNIAAK